MGRVEQRLYRRRKKRAHLYRMLIMLAMLGVIVVVMSHLGGGHSFSFQHLADPTATPVSKAWDQTVETREVLLPQTSWYAIQTGVFSTEAAALEKSDAYADRGAPGVIVQDGDKWRVFIACYGSAGEAASVRQGLEEKQRIDTYQYDWQCPELRLRLSGMAGQLDMAEAGLLMMLQTAEQLRDSAMLMDAGQLTVQEASEMLQTMNGQVTLWRETTCERFGQPRPELIDALLAFADVWSSSFVSLAAAPTSTEMSAGMKCQGMKLYQAVIQFRNTVGG